MLAKSHVISSMIVALPILVFLDQNVVIPFLISVFIGSLAPDLDEEGSFLSRRVYVVSAIVSMMTDHRGITHTVTAITAFVMIGVVLLTLYDYSIMLLIGFMIGYIVHILGDMTTRSGVAVFHPFSNKKYYLLPRGYRLKTASKIEMYLIIPVMAIVMTIELYKIGLFANIVKIM